MKISRFLPSRSLVIQFAALSALCTAMIWAPLNASADPSAVNSPASPGQTVENLLHNASLEQGEGKNAVGWNFSVWNLKAIPGLGEQIEWGLTDVDGQRALSMVSQPGIKANLWWQQSLDVTGTGEYQLSVKLKAESRAEGARGTIGVGIYFLDSAGKWLDFKTIPAPRKLTGQWEALTGKIVAPEGATKMVVRMGMAFEGAVAFYFSSPELKPALQ